MIPEHAMSHLSSAKHRPIPGFTWKPWITEMERHEPTEAETRMNIQVLHCVQTPPPPPPIQGQSDVSFRGFGTLFKPSGNLSSFTEGDLRSFIQQTLESCKFLTSNMVAKPLQGKIS